MLKYEQLVNKKQAVRQISKNQLQELAQQRNLPIELPPGKMVHTRKAGSGAFRSRAEVCGNYQESGNDEVMKCMQEVRMGIKSEHKSVWLALRNGPSTAPISEWHFLMLRDET